MLQRIKTLLGINGTDRDALLNEVLELSTSRVLAYINESALPQELEYVVVEMAIIRFNRIGSEGYSSHTVEGESIAVDTDELESFKGDLNSWLAMTTDGAGKGRVVFL